MVTMPFIEKSRRRGEWEQIRGGMRDDVETLLHRAVYLPERDRILVEQALGGMRMKDLALLRGINERNLRLKLQRLKRMLRDPVFLLATTYVERLPEGVRDLARDYFAGRMTLRAVAGRHRVSLHRVREAVGVVRMMARER